MEYCKIIIADDNNFFLGTLKNYLDTFNEFKVTGTCSTIKETITHTNNSIFDILILDLSFKGERSLDFIQQIRPHKKSFKIICLTSYDHPIVENDALSDGVELFVSKDSDFKEFPSIIKELHQTSKIVTSEVRTSKITLSERQLTVLKCCYEFNTEKEICDYLNISPSTLKMHKQHLFSKTQTNNTLSLIKFGIQEGIIIPNFK